MIALTALAVARPSLSGSWRSQVGQVFLRETPEGLEIDGFRHPYEGPEPGSSNFLVTRLVRTSEGYHLYSESRRTTREEGGPIRVIFQESDIEYQLIGEGKLRVTTVYENGSRRLVSEYWRVDD